MSAEYQAALEASRVATQEFRKAQEAYRRRWIDTDEFLAARLVYQEAESVFDEALALEEERRPDTVNGEFCS